MAHRRRDKTAGHLRRRKNFKKPGDIILIVCEGGETEPNYFKALRNEWRIVPSLMEIVGEGCGNTPLNIVDHALTCKKERARRAKNKSSLELPYDQVWCVFDHDEHPKLSEALQKAEDNGIKVALSVPCFEFWYLIHFTRTTRGFRDCKEVVRYLEAKKYIENYEKSDVPLDLLLQKLDDAYENAEWIRKEIRKSGSVGPMTDVDFLVWQLQKIKHV